MLGTSSAVVSFVNAPVSDLRGSARLYSLERRIAPAAPSSFGGRLGPALDTPEAREVYVREDVATFRHVPQGSVAPVPPLLACRLRLH